MHESGVIKGLVNELTRIASDSGNGKIVHVNVSIGSMVQISKSHFQEHFALATRGTPVEGAEITIHMIEDINDPGVNQIQLDDFEILEANEDA